MHITVLSGSPKGDLSVTLQYVAFIRKKFPHHTFSIQHVVPRIKKLENDRQAFQAVMDEIAAADAVLWAFPLYILLVHGSYKRFIELIWERNAQHVFRDKYAAAISTSIHFYDHTAHGYIHAICDDLGMRYVDFFSAAMQDLMKETERQRLLLFAEHFFETVAQARPTFRHHPPVAWEPRVYEPGAGTRTLSLGGRRAVIVTDATDERSNVARMIARFQAAFSQDLEVVNITTLDIKGGCLGCLECGYDYTCSWHGKDAFVEMYTTKLMTADVLLFAGTIRDRYLSARWKTFFDRSFFNTHTPSLAGKQWGYLISGPLSQNRGLEEILRAWAEFQQSQLVGIVSDELDSSAALDSAIQYLAEQLVWGVEHAYFKPATFLRVGGMKIFRDEVWGPLRAVFQADHRYYGAHDVYDFPQRRIGMRLQHALVSLLFRYPAIRNRFYKRELKPGMIRGLQKVVAQA